MQLFHSHTLTAGRKRDPSCYSLELHCFRRAKTKLLVAQERRSPWKI